MIFYIGDLVQNCTHYIVNALEWIQYCINPLILGNRVQSYVMFDTYSHGLKQVYWCNRFQYNTLTFNS